MAVSAAALAGALAEIVGAEHVADEAAVLARFAVDGRVPGLAVRPAGPEEAARVLALAAAEGLAVCPRGRGGAVELGNPPSRVDLVLDCSRLDRVVEYSPEDMVATVGAGITLSALAGTLEPHGQRLPLDPPGGPLRTVGGVLATADAGPLRYRYGTGRDLLLGVRFVQADGTLTWGGAKVVKSVTGYDVPKLLVGSLGTLGVIVEATLRLHPLPALSRTWLFGFAEADRAGDFLGAVLHSTLEPERLAVADQGLLAAVGVEPAPVGVLVGIGSVPEAVESQGARLLELAAGRGARAAVAAPDVWDRVARALAGPTALRLAGEPARLLHWMGELGRRAQGLGLGVAALGEAASGLVRARLEPAPPPDWGQHLVGPLREALAPEGGSCVVERAPAGLKPADVWGPVPEGPLAVMRRIKHEFDPEGRLNPGRFVGGL